MHNFTQDSQKALAHLESAFNTIKTGRANPTILDSVMVMAWGDRVPLNQVASISVIDSGMLGIKPYDKSTIKEIEKGISDANLGLNPIVDSESIRVPIPALTEETRKSYVKKAKDESENARIAVRQARQDAKQKLEEMKKNNELTEDTLEFEEKKLQGDVDKVNAKIDEMFKAKESSLMAV